MAKLPVIYAQGTTHQPLQKTVGTTGLNGSKRQVVSTKAVVNLLAAQPVKIRK